MVRRKRRGQRCPLAVATAVYLMISAAVAGAYGNPQNDRDFGNAIVVDTRERIVIVGAVHTSEFPGGMHLAVWRFNPDGTPDTMFNSTGRAAPSGIGGEGSGSAGASLVIDSDGRIVAVGAVGHSMAIWRFNDDGTLDTTFNSTGYVTQYDPSVEYDASGGALCLDSGGRILVAGATCNGSDHDVTVWRFNSDGTLDTSFSSTGYVVADSADDGWGRDFVAGIALDSSGRILVVGRIMTRASTETGTGSALRVWRYHPDGTVDTSFNSVGYVTVENASGSDIAMDRHGRIVVVGYVENDFRHQMAVWRFLPGGELDKSFNSVGCVTGDAAFNSFGRAIALDPDGLIVVAGQTHGEERESDMTIWRYRSDGAPDTTFNLVGYVRHKTVTGGRESKGNDMVLDSAGRILITGDGLKPDDNEDNYDMVTWRLSPDGTLDTLFNGVGYLIRDGTGAVNLR